MSIDDVFRAIDEDHGLVELRAYLATGGTPNDLRAPTERRTLLHLAAEHQNLPLIQELLDNGADVNAQDDYGQTPLHVAVDIDIESVVQANGQPADMTFVTAILLLKRGADLNVKDLRGETPMDWVRRYGPTCVARFEDALKGAGVA